MKRILFVDDEPAILDGLQRSLRKLAKDWDMHFAQSGAEALQKLGAGTPFDVIVTDVRMPGMDGAALLTEVSKRFPHMVRMVLTGHSDRREVLESGTLAHQYLMKPADGDMLMEFVKTQLILSSLRNPKPVAAGGQPTPIEGRPQLGFDLNEAIRNSVSRSKREWEGIADVTTDLDPGLPRLPQLEADFPMILLNFMVNAAHAVGETIGSGGKGKISVSTRKAGDAVEILFTDTGPGIPESIRAKAFEWIGKDALRSGPGAWLVLAHAIVTKHNGTIGIETQIGKGTTYTVRVPSRG